MWSLQDVEGFLRHQHQCQEQSAIELQGRNSLLRVILFESPRVVFLANFVLKPQYFVLRWFRTVCEPSSYPGLTFFLRASITSTCPWWPWWEWRHLRKLFGEKLKTATCFSLAIWTNGPEGKMTNPNQVLISERTVFFQLSGVPKARRTPSSAGVSHGALDALGTQQKSSTKTNPQSTSRNNA